MIRLRPPVQWLWLKAHVVSPTVALRTSPLALAQLALPLLLLALAAPPAYSQIGPDDQDPPEVSILTPTSGPTTDRSPAIVVEYEDSGTGIDLDLVRVEMDSIDLTPSCSIDLESTECESPELTDGAHTLTVTVVDGAGNSARSELSFTVDTVAPELGIRDNGDVIFSDGFESGDTSAWGQGFSSDSLLTRHSSPELQFFYSDVLSSVDTASFSLSVDGLEQDPTEQCELTEQEAVCGLSSLMDGSHRVVASLADLAGNAAALELELIVDSAPPSIAAVLDPPPNDSGWHDGPVTVRFECTDETSGILSCPGPVVRSDEGSGQIVFETASDLAGNTSTVETAVSIDTTAPPAPTIILDPPPNDSGWHGGPVTVSFECSDAGSGVVSCPEALLLDSEGADQSVSGTATDAAGNTSVLAETTVSIDTTPPVLSGMSPAECPALSEGSPTRVRACFADSLSGVALESVMLSIDGSDRTSESDSTSGCIEWTAPEPLTSGEHEASLTVTDLAGNTAAIDWCFQIGVSVLEVSIDSPGPGLLTVDDEVNVSGTVEEAVETVEVAGIPAALSDGSFSALGVPLREGRNVLMAVARSSDGRIGTATVVVERDTTAPLAVIEAPRDGAVLGSVQTDVAGFVNDLITGTTINADDCQVWVNGVQARVANRSFLVTDLLLQPGRNRIEAEAVDRLGNRSTHSITVKVQDRTGQRILMRGGNNQSAAVLEDLAEPLVVALEDVHGAPVSGRPVTFEVVRGNGRLSAFPEEGRTVTVHTDELGNASVRYRLGGRSGAGNNRVRATAQGFVGEVELCVDAQPGEAALVGGVSGRNQLGVVEQVLPLPLMVLVSDGEGNPVSGEAVTFEVLKGEGHFEGSPTAVVATDLDGLAEVRWTLGPGTGINENVAVATIAGLPREAGAGFLATGKTLGPASATRISGLVIDDRDEPVAGVTLHVEGTSISGLTDEQGRFSLSGVPVGALKLSVEGQTTPREGIWPHLEFDLTTISGQNNTLDRPIYLLNLSESGVRADHGEDAVLRLEGVPGAELTIFGDSVTCPDGTRDCEVTVTQVRGDRVPMEPPGGSSFLIPWTIQPPGASFDPPARMCNPNTDYEPGEQIETYSFDHDQGAFVAIGTSTVTEDGLQLCTDEGFGVRKGGWHGPAPPLPPPTCANGCDDGNPCTIDLCAGTFCQHIPSPPGLRCDDYSGCGEGVCIADGVCELTPLAPDGHPCRSRNLCLLRDYTSCQAGACVGPEETCDFDENDCVEGTCDPDTGMCEERILWDEPCDTDNNLCTLEFCNGDVCVDTGAERECRDFTKCTMDTCVPETGECAFPADPAQQFEPCSFDDCNAGTCFGTECILSDEQPALGQECNDNDNCTGPDSCRPSLNPAYPFALACEGDLIYDPETQVLPTPELHLPVPDVVSEFLQNGVQHIPGFETYMQDSGIVFHATLERTQCCTQGGGVGTRTAQSNLVEIEIPMVRFAVPNAGAVFFRDLNFGFGEARVRLELGVILAASWLIDGSVGEVEDECFGFNNCRNAIVGGGLEALAEVGVAVTACLELGGGEVLCPDIQIFPGGLGLFARAQVAFNEICGEGLSATFSLEPLNVFFRFQLSGLPWEPEWFFTHPIAPPVVIRHPPF